MKQNHRNLRLLAIILSSVGTLAVLTLILTLMGFIPRSLTIGLASYDVVWLCIAVIVLEMAISTPIQLIQRAQRKSWRQDDGSNKLHSRNDNPH